MVPRFRLFAMLMVVLVCKGMAQTDSQTPYTVCGPGHSASQGPCATPPRAIFAPDPMYSEEARQNKIQGSVVLWLLVGADGKPSNIKVSRSVGHGLDQEAIDAVKKWTFEPATIGGKPVPVQINVEVNFRLSGKTGEPTSSPSPAPPSSQDRKFSIYLAWGKKHNHLKDRVHQLGANSM